MFFHPLVQQGLVVVKDETVKFLAETGSRAEGSNRFRKPFFPFPQPHRVDVGIAYEVQCFHVLTTTVVASFFRTVVVVCTKEAKQSASDCSLTTKHRIVQMLPHTATCPR